MRRQGYKPGASLYVPEGTSDSSDFNSALDKRIDYFFVNDVEHLFLFINSLYKKMHLILLN